MTKRTKNIITLIVIGQILLIGGLLALPTAVQALPGRYRVALQERIPFLGNIVEEVIDQVAPVPTAHMADAHAVPTKAVATEPVTRLGGTRIGRDAEHRRQRDKRASDLRHLMSSHVFRNSSLGAASAGPVRSRALTKRNGGAEASVS